VNSIHQIVVKRYQRLYRTSAANRRRPSSYAHELRIIGLTALLALAPMVTGCTISNQPLPTASPSVAHGAPHLPLDGAVITARFKQLAKGLMIPGAAMLIRTPDGEITATCGTTKLGGSTPVSLDDHVRVGSNTKTWTATAILQLVQEGKIALDDPVSKYRPNVPNGEFKQSSQHWLACVILAWRGKLGQDFAS